MTNLPIQDQNTLTYVKVADPNCAKMRFKNKGIGRLIRKQYLCAHGNQAPGRLLHPHPAYRCL